MLGRSSRGLCSLSFLLLVGCATPEKRIEQHAALFATFPEDVQQDVRAGVVKLGFSPDMVRLAVGSPSHVQSRLDADGNVTIWRYTAYRWRPRSRVWPYRYGGWWSDPLYWDDRQEYDVLRVEFRDGKVAALETAER